VRPASRLFSAHGAGIGPPQGDVMSDDNLVIFSRSSLPVDRGVSLSQGPVRVSSRWVWRFFLAGPPLLG
jgi:hypothetical protein